MYNCVLDFPNHTTYLFNELCNGKIVRHRLVRLAMKLVVAQLQSVCGKKTRCGSFYTTTS